MSILFLKNFQKTIKIFQRPQFLIVLFKFLISKIAKFNKKFAFLLKMHKILYNFTPKFMHFVLFLFVL